MKGEGRAATHVPCKLTLHDNCSLGLDLLLQQVPRHVSQMVQLPKYPPTSAGVPTLVQGKMFERDSPLSCLLFIFDLEAYMIWVGE